ncbi:hypothetical protein BDK51DRAFT_47414 [Blyttiomyces helicus]|uniref:Uncharacterized protein n=1 Tax=Blyttiomyces helicus TaxID=388810 RepID=A0A4P9W3S3_9FUNG|nr:hypothetical protein BDK51DRAFT_47414 [Blyttiomyces helicus]|eukprot:RKO84796.1 hypothetical protein BDK51DRAFT_47414 [Blyttiomyces helicus]
MSTSYAVFTADRSPWTTSVPIEAPHVRHPYADSPEYRRAPRVGSTSAVRWSSKPPPMPLGTSRWWRAARKKKWRRKMPIPSRSGSCERARMVSTSKPAVAPCRDPASFRHDTTTRRPHNSRPPALLLEPTLPPRPQPPAPGPTRRGVESGHRRADVVHNGDRFREHFIAGGIRILLETRMLCLSLGRILVMGGRDEVTLMLPSVLKL